MPKVQDGQNDFSGGSNNRVVSELIGPTQYIDSENAEIRELEIRTRRGSYRLMADESGDVNGAGLFRLFAEDAEIILVAQDNKIDRIEIPDVRSDLPIADGTTSDNFEFVQALDNIYLFRGENMKVMRWDGDRANEFELLTVPTSPQLEMFGSLRVLYEYNRFWVITDDDTINISDLLSEEFAPNFSFSVNQGKDGERLIALFPFGADGSLIAFKEKSIAVIKNTSNFTSITTLQQDFIDKTFGCIAKNSIVGIGNDVWALSRHGIISINRTIQDSLQLIAEPVSANIPKTIARINFAHAEDAQAVWFDNYYLLAVPIDGSQTNNTIIVFDFLTRAFVGLWLKHDVKRFIFSKKLNKDRLYYVNYAGGIVQLQSGLYEDFVHSNVRFLEFHDASSTQTVDITPILSGTDEIDTQTKGKAIIRLRFVSKADGSILFIGDTGASDYLRVYVESSTLKAELVDGGVTQWKIESTDFVVEEFYNLNIFTDGVSPTITIEGVIITQTLTVTTDITKWLDDITTTDARFGSNDTQGGGAITPADAFDGDVQSIIFTADTGLDDIKANFPINEGTGTTITDLENAKTGTLGTAPKDPDWDTAFPAALDIAFKLVTREFPFGTPDLEKRITRGEITFAHRSPNVTVKITGDVPFNEKAIVTNKTYDQTKYTIHSRQNTPFILSPDGNTNFDHDDPWREDYAPLSFNASPNGVEFPGNTATPNGLTFEQEREHSELFQGILITTRAGFEITNSAGTVRIKSLLMQANSKAFAGKRSMDL